MNCFQTLPENYKEVYKLDLKNNKESVIVNVISLLTALVMIFVMNFFVPINTLFDNGGNSSGFITKVIIIIVSLFAYIVLHEAVHGITMKFFGAKNVKFGFKGLYAFAGSADYFSKRAYIVIALAPVVLWLVVLGVINAFVPINYFWVVYAVQIINVSGASGDLYVAVKFAKLNKFALIQDTGTEMIVFEK